MLSWLLDGLPVLRLGLLPAGVEGWVIRSDQYIQQLELIETGYVETHARFRNELALTMRGAIAAMELANVGWDQQQPQEGVTW